MVTRVQMENILNSGEWGIEGDMLQCYLDGKKPEECDEDVATEYMEDTVYEQSGFCTRTPESIKAIRA